MEGGQAAAYVVVLELTAKTRMRNPPLNKGDFSLIQLSSSKQRETAQHCGGTSLFVHRFLHPLGLLLASAVWLRRPSSSAPPVTCQVGGEVM